ncbi:MAG: hypothetical protein ACE5HX_09685, partial [bacterium]
LLGIWGLPDNVVEACAFHHRPSKCLDKSFSPLTAVHVANALEQEPSNRNHDGIPANVDLEYLDKIELTDKLPDWQDFCMKFKQKRGSQ